MGLNINRRGNSARTSENTSLGNPTDNSWQDGYFDQWTKDTQLNDAVDDIAEVFKEIAPAKASTLIGVNLSSAGTMYSGKLSAGLDTKWYLGDKDPGDIITSYMKTSSLVITTPWFRSGKKDKPETYGIVELLKDTISVSSYNVSNGIGGNSVLNVTSLEVYNILWNRIIANSNIILSIEGKQDYAIQHSEAGTSNAVTVYYDPYTGSLTFEESPDSSVDVEVLKYLSGIAYLTIGTELLLNYTAGAGIFNKIYHSSNVSRIVCVGLSTVTVNPSVVPNYDDNFSVSKRVTLNVSNQANNNPSVTVQLYRPDTNRSESVTLNRRICTYGNVSTNTTDEFFDEAKRVELNTNTIWDSSLLLANSNAQVKNGTLEFGSVDYPSKSGVQEYQRIINPGVAKSNGSLSLTGLTYSNISPYGTGNINVLIKLDTENKYFDLGKVYGDNNGNGSGDTPEDSMGSRSSGSSTTVNWTLGLYSTANNDLKYRVIIIFRNNTYSITRLTST